MAFHINRGEQTFGPYSLEDLRRYVSSGNIAPNDLACEEGSTDWRPVSELMAPAIEPAPSKPPVAWPKPPYLPWPVVIVLIFLVGLVFGITWDLIQSWWARKADPTCRAFLWYALAAPFGLALAALQWARVFHAHRLSSDYSFLIPLCFLAYAGLSLFARFELKDGIENAFGDLGLPYEELSTLMTWFFGITYLQFHMNRLRKVYQQGGLKYE